MTIEIAIGVIIETIKIENMTAVIVRDIISTVGHVMIVTADEIMEQLI